MDSEAVERLRRQYTDKYVVADTRRPELRRFQGMTGQVKTVNMTGRALVQFDGHNNSGWYDIDPAALTIVDAPPPKEEKKRPVKAPPAEKAAGQAAPGKDSAA